MWLVPGRSELKIVSDFNLFKSQWLHMPSGATILGGVALWSWKLRRKDLLKRFQKEAAWKARWSLKSCHPCSKFILIPTLPISCFLEGGFEACPLSPSCSQNHSINKMVIRKDFINILKRRTLSRLHKPFDLAKPSQKKYLMRKVLLLWSFRLGVCLAGIWRQAPRLFLCCEFWPFWPGSQEKMQTVQTF